MKFQSCVYFYTEVAFPYKRKNEPLMKWVDFSIIVIGWGFGNIFFNNFEKHIPWWKRLIKLILIVAVLYFIGLIGRLWIYIALGAMATGMGILHLYWFPKKGINGITAEPYDEDLKLINKEKHHSTKNKRLLP